ncbi:MAG: hypothetical protein V4450_04695 [Bacteroidota bacterium]
MKKTLLVFLSLSVSFLAMSQSTNSTTNSSTKLLDLSNRASDHLMIQYGADSWTNRPDSVRTGGFSRHFNIYFMFDKPFKTNQKLSIAYGIGIGTSNMFFNNTNVDIRSTSAKLPFTNVDSANHFSKFKVVNIYAEIPVELRYFSDPANPSKSWKAALGVKVGSLLKTYTKGKNLVNKSGASIYGPSYIQKESNKRYFNGTMMAVTGRIGYGIISLDAGYQINGVLKDGVGPSMNKFSLGVTLSGL